VVSIALTLAGTRRLRNDGCGRNGSLAWFPEREDEYSSVLKGEMGFRIADAEFTAGPGWYMLKPQRVRS
jgi:uncharacterized cupin superfamily protein